MRINRIFLLFISISIGITSMAQQQEFMNKDMQKIAKENSNKNWIFLKENINIDAKSIFLNYKKEFSLSNNDSFVLYKTKKNTDLPKPPSVDGASNPDYDSGVHYRYQQYYKGLRVEHAIYVVHESKGKTESINGDMVNGLNINITTTINEQQALNIALNELQASEYFWENTHLEEALKKRTANEDTSYFPMGELLLASLNTDFQSSSYVLAYKFAVYAIEDHKSVEIYIDALSGNVIKQLPLFTDCNSATVNTIWNGSRGINTECTITFCSSYFLQDDCHGATLNKAVIDIMDWNSTTTSSSSAQNITSSNNTWTSANQRFGGTVLWATKRAYWYYKTNFNRDAYDDNNGNVDGYVNAFFSSSSGGANHQNNASMNNGFMKVGLSSGGTNGGTLANSYGTLDIIGHEYQHAVDANEGQLTYQDESGALDESFADIFGEMSENHTLGSHDWLIGADRTDGELRSMLNPKAQGQPDTYGGTYWCDYTNSTLWCTANDKGGVHTNSGVQNFWFYLFVEGGSGTNDNGNTYSVPSNFFILQEEIAEYIAYMNMSVYMTSSSDYEDARSGSMQAANSAYGACSNVSIHNGKAWHAVGVGMAFTNWTSCSNLNPTSGDILRSGISTATLGGSCSVSITPNNSGDVGISGGDYVDLKTGVSIDPSGIGYCRVSNSLYNCTAYTSYTP